MKTYFALITIILLFIHPSIAAQVFKQNNPFESTVQWKSLNDSSPDAQQAQEVSSLETHQTQSGINLKLTGKGMGLRDHTDDGFYAFTQREGSWTLSCHLRWNLNANNTQKADAGLMIRDTAELHNSAYYALEYHVNFQGKKGGALHVHWRMQNGAPKFTTLYFAEDQLENLKAGVFLRITRYEPLHLFIAEFSTDGKHWTFANGVYFEMDSSVAYGVYIADKSNMVPGISILVDSLQLLPSKPVAHRKMEKRLITSPDPFNVHLNIKNYDSKTESITLTEQLPTDWQADTISHQGNLSEGNINWKIDIPPGETTVSYRIYPSETFKGYKRFLGFIDQTPIFGDELVHQELGLLEHIAQIGGYESLPNKSLHIHQRDQNVTVVKDDENLGYELQAGGEFFYGKFDEGIYVYTKRMGAWSIQTKLDHVQANDGRAFAALMIRETPDDPFSKHYSFGGMIEYSIYDDSTVTEIIRTEDYAFNSALFSDILNDINFPEQSIYFRITRYPSMDLFVADWSLDGKTWKRGRHKMLFMEKETAYGLFANYGDVPRNTVLAAFREVELKPATPLVKRHFNPSFYIQGQPISVELEIINDREQAQSINIIETVPKNCKILAHSENGIITSENTVTFSIRVPPGITKLNYSLLPNPDENNILQFNGQTGDRLIYGERSIGPQLKRVKGYPDTNWRFWDESDGLNTSYQNPQSLLTVNREGILHIRKEDRLYQRFDGYNFENITISEDVSGYRQGGSLLTGRDLPLLFEDSLNNSWIWHFHATKLLGIARRLKSEQDWDTFLLEKLDQNAFWKRSMYPIDNNRILYSAYNDKYLYLYNFETKQLKHINLSNSHKLGALSEIKPARNGGIWLAGEKGLAKLEWINSPITKPTWDYYQLLPSMQKAGTILINPIEGPGGTVTCQQVDKSSNQFISLLYLDPINYIWKEGSQELKLAFIDEYGTEWGVDHNNKLKVHDDQGTDRVFADNYLSSEIIDLEMDPTGYFWINSQYGLARKTPTLFSPPPAITGISEPIYSIHQDMKGTLWFAGKNTIASLNKEWSVYTLPNEYKISSLAWKRPTIASLPDSSVLFSGYSYDSLHYDVTPMALVFNPDETNLKPLFITKQGLGHATSGQNGNIWIRTTHGSILEWNGKEFLSQINIAQPRSNDEYFPLRETKDEDLFVAHKNRITIYSNDNQTISQYEQNSNQTKRRAVKTIELSTLQLNSKPSNIGAIHQSDEDVIWIGAGDTLYRYQQGLLETERYDIGEINAIMSDQQTGLWVATQQGLYRHHHNVWQQYLREDGLPHSTVYSVFKDSENRIWIGTAQGIRVYNPHADKDAPETTILSDIKNFSPEVNVEISYTGIDKWKMTKKDKLLFSTRLNGGAWSPFTSSTRFRKRLHPSDYHLEVISMDRNWNVDETPASIHFRVNHPWFMEPIFLVWFIAGTIITFILGFYAIKRHIQLQHSIGALQETQSHLRWAKEKAEAATQTKSHFLAKMSHEIRTPLNGIIGNIELLTLSDPNPKQMNLLQSANLSAQTLLGIIGDVLDFAKIEANRIEIEEVRMSPKGVMEEVFSMMCIKAHQKNLTMVADIDPSIPQYALSDPIRLRQILINLIGNALKFTEEGGIFLKMHRELNTTDRTLILFEVLDTGIGFDLSQKENLFKEFVQDESTSQKSEGTGLGLAICKRIIEIMGGTISCEGYKGFGAIFRFTLPFRVLEETNIKTVPMLDKSILLVKESHTKFDSEVKSILQQQDCQWDEVEQIDHVDKQKHYDYILVFSNQDGSTSLRVKDSLKSTTAKWILLSSTKDHLLPFKARQQGYLYVIQELLDQNHLLSILTAEDQLTKSTQSTHASTFDLDQTRAFLSAINNHQPILAVDDTMTNRTLVKHQLELLGIQCDLAENGLEALKKAQSNHYAAMLVDCSMPIMDGYEFTRQFRNHESLTGQRTPIIAMTAHVVAGDREKCLEAGMDDYLSKPVRIDRLASILKKWINESQIEIPEVDTIPSTSTPVDINWLENELGLDDPKDLNEVLTAFIEDINHLMDSFKQAVLNQNAQTVQQLAHAAKSAANSAAAFTLANLFKEMENEAFTLNWNVLNTMLIEAQKEYESVKHYIYEYVHSLEG